MAAAGLHLLPVPRGSHAVPFCGHQVRVFLQQGSVFALVPRDGEHLSSGHDFRFSITKARLPAI